MATNRRELLGLSGALLAALAGCVRTPGSGGPGLERDPDVPSERVVPDVDAADLDALARANTAFAFDIYETLASDRPGDDHLVAPFSLSLTLAMVLAGARGDTARAMADALHVPFEPDELHPAWNALDRELGERGSTENGGGDVELNVASALWPREGLDLREEFLTTLAAHYGVRPVEMDFTADAQRARAAINRWVAGETDGEIDELFGDGSLGPNTTVVLTNAIYFGADWQEQFDEADTEDAEFTALDGSTGTVPMMSQSGSFPYAEGGDYQAIELPYVGGETSMVVVLPADGAFEAVEASLDAARLSDLLAELDEQHGTVRLPRFEARASYELSAVLGDLGMEAAFGPAADFGGMVDGGGASLDTVAHDAVVTVDEEGTEAAAASGAGVTVGAPREAFEVTVDRPFLFLIRDRPTESVMFLGRVVDVPAPP